VEARNKRGTTGVLTDMRSALRALLLVIACWLVVSAFPLIAQETYFPKNALSDDSWGDQFKAKWYSQELNVLEEPSLLERAKNPSFESYRFLWLRSFNHPVAIRLDMRADGIGVLTTKVASGAGGFRPGHIIENTSRPLTREQTQAFLARVQKLSFWSLPSHVDDQTGTDGSQWIVEGVKEGKYHVADRWSPDKGPVRELGINLTIGLAQMNVPKAELY
jgi:hypothetical protein